MGKGKGRINEGDEEKRNMVSEPDKIGEGEAERARSRKYFTEILDASSGEEYKYEMI